MPVRLHQSDPEFDTRLHAFLAARRAEATSRTPDVAAIIARVRMEGDAALFDYTHRWDRVTLSAQNVRVTAAECEAARQECAPFVVEALENAARRIAVYHEAQRPADHRFVDADGVSLGWQWRAIDAVGLYVPGGQAAYPSSVLMNAVPAKVAGVARLAMVVPAPDGVLNPAVLTAATIAGVDEIYKIGGAQAVAALAYGTESIAPVDKIVGPGSAWVAEAKRQVFGQVGIDMIAGPSEICVLADAENPPEWIAADLLSQAEHDAEAQSILITDDAAFAQAVEEAVVAMLAELPRGNIAGASWEQYGGVIVVDSLEDAVPVIDRIAPEHLELAVAKPEPLAAQIRHAGAIFLGRHTPEAIGDYVAGPSHVLPTSGTARFSSGLGVLDFMKRTSLIAADAAAVQAIGKDAAVLAAAEGLQAHERSVRVRLK